LGKNERVRENKRHRNFKPRSKQIFGGFGLMEFNEFELLTLREGLFSLRRNPEILNEKEFKEIDNKIKYLVGKL